MLISTVLYSFLVPLIKKAGREVPPFTSMAIAMFVLFFISLIASLLFEKGALPKLLTQKTPLTVLILFGAINAVGFWLLIVASKTLPAGQVSMFGVLTPILSGILAFFILGEVLSLNLIMGLIIAGIGLYIAIR